MSYTKESLHNASLNFYRTYRDTTLSDVNKSLALKEIQKKWNSQPGTSVLNLSNYISENRENLDRILEKEKTEKK